MTDSQAPLEGLPMVTDPTRSQSENVETVISRLNSGRIIIPDYQRDADQWDARKESLFIESVLNNLTVPAFFFSERPDGTIEVIDGQQRLNTLWKYSKNELAISDEEDMVYLSPQSVHYRGKKLSDLHQQLQAVFHDYPLTIIYLPRNIDLSSKLEIFRRINEGGTPLTAQDIRLAYYSQSQSVMFVRLAGLHGSTQAASRMLASAERLGVANPWVSNPEAFSYWCDWWEGKTKSRGQTPSEMFLWYEVTLHRNALDNLVSSPDQMKHLPITFRGSTEEVLDIYCAQLHWSDAHGGPTVFPTYASGLQVEFNTYANWLKSILARGMAGLSVDKYKQASLLVAAATELGISPDQISDDAWDAIADFIRTPRKAGSIWFSQGWAEQKGRWRGEKGQKSQCDQVVVLLQKILDKYS
ncbi:MAG: DUF262 domain-containing protein [Sphingomonadaceae bacterium]